MLVTSPHARPVDGARLMDLSEGGAFLVVPSPMRAGDGIELLLRAPAQVAAHAPAHAPGSAAGHVIRALPFGARTSGVAVVFDRVDDGLRAFLRALARTPEPQRPAFLDTLSEVLIRLRAPGIAEPEHAP